MSVLALFAFLCPAAIHTQEKIRTLEHQRYKYKNEPVEIVSRMINGNTFTSEGKVISGSNWLRNLSLGIKNVSSKNIIYLEIHLVDPDRLGSFVLFVVSPRRVI